MGIGSLFGVVRGGGGVGECLHGSQTSHWGWGEMISKGAKTPNSYCTRKESGFQIGGAISFLCVHVCVRVC